MSLHQENDNARTGGSGFQAARLLYGEAELSAHGWQGSTSFESNTTLVPRLVQGLSWLARLATSWWTRARVHDELMEMDDRLLADIGISRADIPDIAAGRYRDHAVRARRPVSEQPPGRPAAGLTLGLDRPASRVA